MSEKLSRRDFVKKSLTTSLSIGAVGGLGYWLATRKVEEKSAERVQKRDYSVVKSAEYPDLAVIKGESPGKSTEAAIKELGGIERFISRGDKVIVKPNIGWDRVPAQAANTNPDVVRTIVELCYGTGASKVIVTDVSCNDPMRSFQRSGIAKAVKKAGGIVQLPHERNFRLLKIQGIVLDEWPVYKDFIEADKVINVPIAKHHNLSGVTMALKNWYGIIGGRREALHQSIDDSIADLATFMTPTLTVLDAYRILVANGPQGGDLADVREIKTIAAGTDQVSVDAYGATFFGKKAEDFTFIKVAAERGIGKMDLNEIRIKEGTI